MIRLLLFMLFLGVFAQAQELEEETPHDPLLEGPGVSVDLVPVMRGFTPGSGLQILLHFHHHPGFHTYWKNPGIVGMATSIEWTLPEGFTASDIIWPYPERTFMGEYPCYGYERDVALIVIIDGPKNYEEKTLTLEAKASWMACAKGCFPGYASFSLTVPVTQKIEFNPSGVRLLGNGDNFTKDSPFKVKALSKIDAATIQIQITGNEQNPVPDDLYFFSEDGQISSETEQKITEGTNGSKVITMTRSKFSPKGKRELIGVLKSGEEHFLILALYPRS